MAGLQTRHRLSATQVRGRSHAHAGGRHLQSRGPQVSEGRDARSTFTFMFFLERSRVDP